MVTLLINRGNKMQQDNLKYLKIALYVFGGIFIVGVPAMMMVIWPSGWGWTPAQP